MDTSPSISLARAFGHCASTSSYWWGIAIVVLIVLAGWAAIKFYFSKQNYDTSKIELGWLIVSVFAIAIAIFLRPCNVAANTSEVMAAAGHWLGY